MIDVEEIRTWFVQELNERMEDDHLRSRDVARHCQISQDRFNNYLQGRAFPNPFILAIIADFLGCTVNDLLDFDEPDDGMLVGYEPLSMFEDVDEFMTHIRNRLEQYMGEFGISITDLSEKTGFNKRTIKYWLGKLKQQPTLIRTSDLLRICDALDCTPSDLLGY